MFLDFYGLREQPFGVTPNPRFLYPSPNHREVLASLVYAIQSDLGFSALIAGPGMGKTTLLFDLLERFRNSANTAFLFHTQCSSQDLIRYLLGELGVTCDGRDLVEMHEKFRDLLLNSARENKKVLIILDEAHNLEDDVLESVRLLSNFETAESKLLHIVLAGQTHLAEKLMRPGMAQFYQRISIVNRIKPLTYEEACGYIAHRLEVAGYNRPAIFTHDALAKIAAASRGVPRTINQLCFGAMSLGCALGQPRIDGGIIDEVIADLNLSSLLPQRDDAEPYAPRESLSSRDAGTARPYAEPRATPPPLGLSEIPIDESKTLAQQRPPGKAAMRAEAERRVRAADDHQGPPRAAKIATVLAFILAVALVSGLFLRGYLPNQNLRASETANSNAPPAPVPSASSDSTPATPTVTDKPRRSKMRAMLPESDQAAAANQSTTNPGGAVHSAVPSSPNATSTLGTNLQSSLATTSGTPTTTPANPIAAAPTYRPPEKTVSSEVPEPPQVNVPSHDAQGQLAGVMGQVMTYTPDVVADVPPAARSTLVPGHLVKKIQPTYPDEAKRLGIQGSVLLNAVIGKDGSVKEVRALQGDPRLSAAAQNAVHQWKYEPYTLNGEPVEVETEITVRFSLGNR